YYLRQLNLEPAEAVRLIVCTHWHSDHVRGLSDLVRECAKARFVCSLALVSNQFKEIVARFSATDLASSASLPLREVREVFQILPSRRPSRSSAYLPPKLAQADLPLERFATSGVSAEIHALSPSDQDVIAALESFAGFFVPLSQAATGLSPVHPNHAS